MRLKKRPRAPGIQQNRRRMSSYLANWKRPFLPIKRSVYFLKADFSLSNKALCTLASEGSLIPQLVYAKSWKCTRNKAFPVCIFLTEIRIILRNNSCDILSWAAWKPPSAPEPRGTSPVGSPRRISRRVPPPLRGLEGGFRPHRDCNLIYRVKLASSKI